MKKKLIQSITQRVRKEIAPQNPLKYLKVYEVEEYINALISTTYLYTRQSRGASKTVYFTEVIASVGHKVRETLGQKKDSALAAKTGAFLVYSFEQLGILRVKMGKGKRGHGTYIVDLLNDDILCELWQALPIKELDKFPQLKPYAPWETTRHSTGVVMVKTGNKEVLSTITLPTHPMLFDCLNRAQKVGWRINTEIYQIQRWALRNKTDAFTDIWEQHNPEAKATKLREARAIDMIANRFLGETFYHLYYYDFRARKYAATAYLHEQGPDLAKGLLLRDASAPIGKGGFFWLLVSIATNWGGESGREDNLKTDKLPLHDRSQWTLDNEDIILSYAENPKVHQGWMKADKPWQFLAACIELGKVRVWEMEHPESLKEEYVSHLECFIDGSNNGSQHLTALTRDEVTAPHVNLVPLAFPGDLYRYVGEHVWEELAKEISLMTAEEIDECEFFIDTLIDLKRKLIASPDKSPLRAELTEMLSALKSENPELMTLTCPVFWLRIRDAKQKRKIVKRNTMTLPYGGTPYGLGQQVIDDSRKLGIEQLLFMEHKWGAYLGRLVFNDCKLSLRRPMQLLSIFEGAGKLAETEGRFLKWTSPFTKFPVVQNYTEGTTKKTWVQYGPPKGVRTSTGYFENTFQLHVCFIEDTVPSKRKQSQGAAPNAIHSLDATHLIMTVCGASYAVTTVHDSFGCLLADMPDLFKLIRETFVELYTVNPLNHLLEEVGGDISKVDIGTLDINLILESEYCFA